MEDKDEINKKNGPEVSDTNNSRFAKDDIADFNVVSKEDINNNNSSPDIHNSINLDAVSTDLNKSIQGAPLETTFAEPKVDVEEANISVANFETKIVNNIPSSPMPSTQQSNVSEAGNVPTNEVLKLREHNKKLKIWIVVLVVLFVSLASAITVYFFQQSHDSSLGDGSSASEKDAERESDVKALATAAENYFLVNNGYPGDCYYLTKDFSDTDPVLRSPNGRMEKNIERSDCEMNAVPSEKNDIYAYSAVTNSTAIPYVYKSFKISYWSESENIIKTINSVSN